MHPHGMTHSNQFLVIRLERCKADHAASPGQILVTQMLTRDLFAVANLAFWGAILIWDHFWMSNAAIYWHGNISECPMLVLCWNGCTHRQFLHHLVDLSLHCALAAAQCIVIGPVCLFATGGRAGGVCGRVYGSVTTITRNCVHRSSPNWVCRWRCRWPSPAD